MQPEIEPARVASMQQEQIRSTGASQMEVLRSLGYWTGLDATCALIVTLTIFLTVTWNLFGDPDTLGNLAVLAGLLCFLNVWVILLTFRVARFILETRAEINLMPEVSARIAVAYLQGQKPPSRA